MKFEVGDNVKVLDGKNIKDYTSGWDSDCMGKYVGTVQEVINILDNASVMLKGSPLRWDVRGLEKVNKPNEAIVIYRKDNEVIALDKTTGNRAVAKCSPEDKFDFHVGVSLAFGRLICQELLARVVKNHKLYMDSADGKIFSNIEQIAKYFANFKNQPMSELLGYKEKPKLYNGKVVCVKTYDPCLTVGKIYEFVDGHSKYDNGDEMPISNDGVKSFDDLKSRFCSEFIEIVEEK